MMKLNNLIKMSNLETYGFKAFTDLKDYCNKEGESVVLSTLSPSIMADKGIIKYYAPVLTRNTVFNTAEEVMQADLEANCISVSFVEEINAEEEVIICSRHVGTVEILKNMYPNNIVMDSISPEEITGKNVVGTLPPHLIRYAARYKAVTIADFDYSKDSDLSGEELKERLQINRTINVEIVQEEVER